MATELADIANNAGIKIGGFGDQLDASGQITQTLLDTNADPVSQAINTKYPVVRKRVLKQFADLKSPFPETQKFADLGDDLKKDDISISTISGTTTVTVVTSKVHEKTTGDTVFLADIAGDGGITALNGTTKTVTVVDTLTLTLDSTVGLSAWDHTDGTGIVSKVPEMGAWNYAFTLPSDFFALVMQTDEAYYTRQGVRTQYQCDKILNIDGDGFLLVTNFLTNCDADSAYIEYCIDQTAFAMFSSQLEEALAMMLAYELCPIVGKNLETRQAILVEYRRTTVPGTLMANQAQTNKTSKHVPDYSGGRSEGGVVPVKGRGNLGTYVTATGGRKGI